MDDGDEAARRMPEAAPMIEIERKFLVRDMDFGTQRSSRRIEQGYLFSTPERNLRVRRSGDDYTLTLKVRAGGISRHEIETAIDAEQGQRMLDLLCVGQPIRKTRHIVDHAGKTWEIDVFDGANAGLVVAEIELSSEGEAFEMPPWAGPEVTDDARFLNAELSRNPFCDWGVTYAALLAEKDAAT
ncbi:MAG: CYTH domain-containing protein [Alphaproteobacteria bacterium]